MTSPDHAGSAWATVQNVPGLSYRRWDHWCTKGYIQAGGAENTGSGIPRTITPAEIHVLTLMTALVDAGVTPEAAARVARELAINGVGALGGFRVVTAT